jgi:putative component of membrane protein insertase Oxa1/YidC/SpoIIIJ protein YidD
MKHGPVKGMILGVSRVFRCVGILFSGGRDEVPEVFSFRAIADGYRRFIKSKNRTDR